MNNMAMARMGVFVVFLLAAAWQDFGTKQVSAEIFWLSGAAALVCQSMSVLSLVFAKDVGAVEPVFSFFLNVWQPYLAGVLPGAVLLLLSRLGVGIGAGDGYFFLVSGLFLGLWRNLFFLCGTVLCSGLFGLSYYVWCFTRGNHTAGKTELPLLPFAVVPGIWSAVLYMTQIQTVGI